MFPFAMGKHLGHYETIQLTNETVVCKKLDRSIGSQMLTKCECFCLIREKTQVGLLLYLVH